MSQENVEVVRTIYDAVISDRPFPLAVRTVSATRRSPPSHTRSVVNRGSLRRSDGLRYGENQLSVLVSRRGRKPIAQARTFVVARRSARLARLRAGPVTAEPPTPWPCPKDAPAAGSPRTGASGS